MIPHLWMYKPASRAMLDIIDGVEGLAKLPCCMTDSRNWTKEERTVVTIKQQILSRPCHALNFAQLTNQSLAGSTKEVINNNCVYIESRQPIQTPFNKII